MKVLDRVKQIVGHELGLEWASIDADAEIMAELGADSLHMAQIILNSEEEFEVRIPEEEAMDVKTSRDIAKYVEMSLRDSHFARELKAV
jgi:acyl carrier protein